MSEPQQRHPAFELARRTLGSPRFSAALTQAIIGALVSYLFLRELMGWAGWLAVLTGLVVLASLSLLAQRDEIEWHGLLPISLLIFVGWAAISGFWSEYNWATVGAVIFSGILIDTPLGFLRIEGNLRALGPIQGIFGTRNQLGIVALLAIVTFATELRTRSVPRNLAIGSLALAGIMLLFARSPIAFGTFVIVMLATLALYGLRSAAPGRKRVWQFVLLGSTITIGAIAWAVRTPIIAGLSASIELNLRLAIWRPIRLLIPVHELEGWGWAGHWWEGIPPFTYIRDGLQPSALNAYLDVWFQLGLIGLVAFVFMVGLAFIRSWLLASRQRSFVYAWPALVLLVLLVTALAESSLFVEFGWLTFVVCAVKASRELSWRKAFAATGSEILK